MPLPFRPNCLPTALGPLPHPPTVELWDVVLPRLRQIVPVPLLDQHGEDLLRLALHNLPGATMVGDHATWGGPDMQTALDTLYIAYLKHQTDSRALDLAALEELEQSDGKLRSVQALSTVQWGPFSLALTLINTEYESALNDPTMVDAIVKHLYLQLQFQAERLGHWHKPVLQWLYEPYLELLGSPFVSLTWEAVHDALTDVWGQHSGVRGVWVGAHVQLQQLLASETVEVVGLTLPTPEQAESWAPDLHSFIRRKGAVGWGIVPVTSDGLRQVTAGRLAARFGSVLKALQEADLPVEYVVRASMIMPEDTLHQLSPAEAERVLTLTADLAELLRQAYAIE